MNFSFGHSEASQISPSSIPGLLWSYYIHYLWLYGPDSWVSRFAKFFRVLAILIILPIVILGLLDITSYGIARTLGVIDDVRASTSDKKTVHPVDSPPPSIILAATSSSSSTYSDSDVDHSLHNRTRSPLSLSAAHSISNSISESCSLSSEHLDYGHDHDDMQMLSSQPSVFYANNLKLSDVGVFSPMASLPPSPTSSRRHLPLNADSGAASAADIQREIRHRTQNNGGNDG